MYNHTAAFAHKGAQVTAGPALSMHPSIMSASSPRLAFCGGRGVGEAVRIRGALPATPPNTIAQLINRISYLPQAGFYVPGSYILCSNIFLCDETQLASSVNDSKWICCSPSRDCWLCSRISFRCLSPTHPTAQECSLARNQSHSKSVFSIFPRARFHLSLL